MNKFGKISVFTAGVMFLVAAFFCALVAWNLKSSNRNNVDITVGLAYLRPILITGTILFVLILSVSAITRFLALER